MIRKVKKRTKAIRVSEDMHEILTKIKIEYKYKTYEDIINIITELHKKGIFEKLVKIKEDLRLKTIDEVIDYLVSVYYNRWRVGL